MKRSLFFLVLAVVATTQAQTLWTHRSQGPQIKIEVLRPSIKSDPQIDFSSTIVTVSGRIPISKGFAAEVEVPYVSESVSSPYSSVSKRKIGNPYVGVEMGSEEFPVYAEFGFRPMVLTSSDYFFFGSYVGDFDRGEAYIDEITTYQLALNVASHERQGFVYRVKVGPTIWSPKSGKSTTLMDYGGNVGYDNGAVSAYAGVTGRWNTEVKGGKSAYHFVGLDLGYRIDKFRPALFAHFPLDKEISDMSPQTFGASIGVEF